MLLKIRNINKIEEVTIFKNHDKVLLENHDRQFISAEIEPNCEYKIVVRNQNGSFFKMIFLWLFSTVIFICGNKTENNFTDILSFNQKIKDAYCSYLLVTTNKHDLDTQIIDYKKMRCIEVLCFDEKNNSNARIRYERQYSNEEIKEKYQKWLCERTLNILFCQLLLISLAISFFAIDMYILNIIAFFIAIYNIALIVNFLALLTRSSNMYHAILKTKILDFENAVFRGNNRKKIYLKNNTDNDIVMSVKMSVGDSSEFVLFAGSNKRVFCSQIEQKILLETYEMSFFELKKNVVFRSIYCFLNFLVFNCHFATLLKFDNWMHKNMLLNQWVDVENFDEIQIEYTLCENRFDRSWKVKSSEYCNLEQNNVKRIEVMDSKECFALWKGMIVGAVSIYCLLMFAVMSVVRNTLGILFVIITLIFVFIKVVKAVIVLFEGQKFFKENL